MADTHMGYGPGAAPTGTAAERLRTFAIVVYVLYLLATPFLGVPLLIGAMLAYAKKSEAKGTAFESHFANAIDVFWVSLVIGIVALPLWPLFFLGGLIHMVLLVWVLYRSVKGLMRAIEWQPYDQPQVQPQV
jgi:uncharacterized membrane protein